MLKINILANKLRKVLGKRLMHYIKLRFIKITEKLLDMPMGKWLPTPQASFLLTQAMGSVSSGCQGRMNRNAASLKPR